VSILHLLINLQLKVITRVIFRLEAYSAIKDYCSLYEIPEFASTLSLVHDLCEKIPLQLQSLEKDPEAQEADLKTEA
jgi:hypothetical protein